MVDDYKFVGYYCSKCNRVITNITDESCIFWKKEHHGVTSEPVHSSCGTVVTPQYEPTI